MHEDVFTLGTWVDGGSQSSALRRKRPKKTVEQERNASRRIGGW
jgi:hypothetical protein